MFLEIYRQDEDLSYSSASSKKMDAYFVFVSRLTLFAVLVFGSFQQSESITFRRKPDNPTVVVEGVNSTRVNLVWEFNDVSQISIISINREIAGSPTSIAVRRDNNAYEVPNQLQARYEARHPATLVLKDVKRNEEYGYTIQVFDNSGTLLDKVTINVVVPPKITTVPTRQPLFTIGQNYTLTCNASGDPFPKINWTKDGTPGEQLNVTGYRLHFVKVKREDAGSYRCTASNGYGEDATSVSIVGIRCNDCENMKVGITLQSENWISALNNRESIEFETLESKLLSEISSVYTKNPGKELYRLSVDSFRSGSVVATVELVFGKSVTDPLKPIQDEISDGKLGSFTVGRELDLNPTTPPPTSPSGATTDAPGEPPSTGARTSGLSQSELWGIIGGCIAFVLVVIIIIVVACICCRKKGSGGASKGGRNTYSEADGYRMNKQPPSGLGTASPAYVEARQYAPVSSARRQDDQPKQLNYADLSFNNSSSSTKQPPPYSATEYSEMAPQKRGPPGEDKQGEGGGFELWC